MFLILINPRLHPKHALDRLHHQHFRRRTIPHDDAVVEQDQSRKTPDGHAEVVHHRPRPRAIPCEPLQELHDMALMGDVEIVRRLIEEEKLWSDAAGGEVSQADNTIGRGEIFPTCMRARRVNAIGRRSKGGALVQFLALGLEAETPSRGHPIKFRERDVLSTCRCLITRQSPVHLSRARRFIVHGIAHGA